LIGSNMIVARKDKLTAISQHRVTNMLAGTFVTTYMTPLTGVKKEQAVVDDATNSFYLLGSDDDQSKVSTLLARVDLPVERAITRNLGVAWQTSVPMTLQWTTPVATGCCPVISAPDIANILITTPAILFTINNLIQENRSKLLANPRLAVRDGETAKMNIGDK